MSNFLEIRIRREGKAESRPEDVDFAADLSPLVRSISEAAVIEAGVNPTRGKGSSPSLALESLTPVRGLAAGDRIAAPSYRFLVNKDLEAAVSHLTAGLAGDPGVRLVPQAAERLLSGVNRARKRFTVQIENGVVTPAFSKKSPPPMIASVETREFDTEIGVYVEWTGGRRPSAKVILHGSGQRITVNLPTEAAMREVLHHDAVLSGRAQYVVDPDRFYKPVRLLSFKTTSYKRLRRVATEVLFEELAAATGGVWDAVDPSRPLDDDSEVKPDEVAQ